jgi:hypothetical protein
MPKPTLNPHVITFDPDPKSPSKGFDKDAVTVDNGHQVNFELKAISGGPARIMVQITAKPGTDDPNKLFGASSFEVKTNESTVKTVQPHVPVPGRVYEYEYARAPLFKEEGEPWGVMTGTITVSPTPGNDE